DLQGAIKSALACQISGARQILGFRDPWLRERPAGIFYTRRVSATGTHVVEANLALAAALGAARPVFEFPIPPGHPSAIPSGIPAGELALINPGAGWQAKQWSAAGYSAICDALEERFALPVVLNCGPGETGLAEQVRGLTQRARPSLFSGPIPGLIALLR